MPSLSQVFEEGALPLMQYRATVLLYATVWLVGTAEGGGTVCVHVCCVRVCMCVCAWGGCMCVGVCEGD